MRAFFAFLFGLLLFPLAAAPVIQVCDANGSTKVRFSIEYAKPYWTVGKGRSTTNRIFRYDEGPRRIQPIQGQWIMELKKSTPQRLVDRKGKVILEYRDGKIYKPGQSTPVGVLKNNFLYRGNGTTNCVANFRKGTPPTGLALAIAAQYYLAKDLGFQPIKVNAPPQPQKLYILSLPFKSKENKTVYTDANGKILYTFLNGFIYEGENTNQKARYAVAIGKFAAVGKKKKTTPYIIHFHDLHTPRKDGKPDYVFQSIVRHALFKGDSIKNPPWIQLGGKGMIYAGALQKDPIGKINNDGSQVFRINETAPLLKISGNRANYWVEMFIWAKLLEKDAEKYLQAHPEANVPFPAKK